MSFRNSQPYEWGGSYILLFEIYMHVIVAIIIIVLIMSLWQHVEHTTNATQWV